ncbi:PREDICTED: 2'-deoxynucleoside 5'-phosphate N-hydrolase 1-like [Priapulus caudatus]|uniref:Putative 2'-deoxynucleoside 5'-phosphate N-hydrolase 1 n=1 Tax=Priapulus caudatus TaxID=37621 RepID=A0ABM1EC49_PRICU|nr:PREDICTED: 2'-deoxynucleoside 5'-phosphate N-hydrolase 1-like [Priapulus caudatus]
MADIYFCGSIRGGRQDAELYARVIKMLGEYGQVLTEHVGHKEIGEKGDDMDEREIHDRNMKWLDQAEFVVAEVSQPSLGVGYEIGQAVNMEKRILCLFRESCGRSLSCMIRGLHNDQSVVVKDYKEADLPAILKEFFSEANNGVEASQPCV